MRISDQSHVSLIRGRLPLGAGDPCSSLLASRVRFRNQQIHPYMTTCIGHYAIQDLNLKLYSCESYVLKTCIVNLCDTASHQSVPTSTYVLPMQVWSRDSTLLTIVLGRIKLLSRSLGQLCRLHPLWLSKMWKRLFLPLTKSTKSPS
jgi:hypothetical protein